MRPWELLLRNANVLQSVFEKPEPELSLLELDARRLFILCTVEARAFPADRLPSGPSLRKLNARIFRRRENGGKRMVRRRLPSCRGPAVCKINHRVSFRLPFRLPWPQ